MDVSYRSVKGVIFVVPCGNGDSCFITPQDYWYKHGAVRRFILGNDVLAPSEKWEQKEYRKLYAPLGTKPNQLRKSLVIAARHLVQTPRKGYSQTPHQSQGFPPAHEQQ